MRKKGLICRYRLVQNKPLVIDAVKLGEQECARNNHRLKLVVACYTANRQ